MNPIPVDQAGVERLLWLAHRRWRVGWMIEGAVVLAALSCPFLACWGLWAMGWIAAKTAWTTAAGIGLFGVAETVWVETGGVSLLGSPRVSATLWRARKQMTDGTLRGPEPRLVTAKARRLVFWLRLPGNCRRAVRLPERLAPNPSLPVMHRYLPTLKLVGLGEEAGFDLEPIGQSEDGDIYDLPVVFLTGDDLSVFRRAWGDDVWGPEISWTEWEALCRTPRWEAFRSDHPAL